VTSLSLKKDWSDFGIYVDQIEEIENDSFPVPWGRKAFEEEINNKISNFWALISGQKLLAYICFWMFDKEIHILNFAVHPLNRNQGLGNFLLKKVIDAGNIDGVESIWLEVRPSNIPALSIYKKFGFIEAGRRTGYYSDSKEDAIIMALNLKRKQINTISLE
jgi:ribosomal-protein-alanine N-acetyltransferase